MADTLVLSKTKNTSTKSRLQFDPENPNAPVTLIVTDNTTVGTKTTGITKTYTQNSEGQFVDSSGSAWSGEYNDQAKKVRAQMGQKINSSDSNNETKEAWAKDGRATGMVTKDTGNAGGGDGKDKGETTVPVTVPFKVKSVSRKSYGNLVYPKERLDGQDFCKITMFKYEPGKFKAGKDSRPNQRITQSLGTVTLPIPPGLTDDNGTSWNGHTMNALQAQMGQSAMNVMDSDKIFAAAGEEAGNMIEKAKKTPGLKAMAKAWALGGIPGLGANTSQALARSQGAIINPNEELLFGGPTMRNRSYGWRLTPRFQQESDEVMKIIRFFKQGMAAQVSTDGGLFLVTPNVFHVQFYAGDGKEHPFIGKMKKAALTSMTVNYVPDGTYMTLPNNSMTAYDLGLNFGELEPILEDDYGMSTNDIGY